MAPDIRALWARVRRIGGRGRAEGPAAIASIDLRAVRWRHVSGRRGADGEMEYRVLQHYPPLGDPVPWRQAEIPPHGRRAEPRP